jgi:5-methylcytosine-specific restriction endonuclease McrA
MFILTDKKRCGKCKKWKSLEEFSKNKTTCRECRKGETRAYKDKYPEKVKETRRSTYANHKEKTLETNRQYRKRNANKILEIARKWKDENIEKVRRYRREWQARNKEKARKIKKNWRDNNLEKARANRRKWLADNPEKNTVYLENRRASKIKNGGTITEKEWKDLCEKYGNMCLCCKRADVRLTLDHVVPLSSGGANTIGNAQPLCLSCNSAKGAKTIDYRGKYG